MTVGAAVPSRDTVPGRRAGSAPTVMSYPFDMLRTTMADMPLDPDMIPEMFAPTTSTEWGVLWAPDERGPWRIAEGGVAEALESAADLLYHQRRLESLAGRSYDQRLRDVQVYTRAILSTDAAWPKEYPYTDLRPIDDVLGPVVVTMIEV